MVKSRKKKPAKAENASSVTRAFHELRELIVRGDLPPGTWIVEAEIASRLGLSRTPIRSALQWLHRDGYVVEHKGNRKARIVVAPLTRAKLADTLAALNDRLNTIASQRPVDPRRAFELDKEFHQRVIEADAGHRLAALHNSVRPQVERYWRLYASCLLHRPRPAADVLSLSDEVIRGSYTVSRCINDPDPQQFLSSIYSVPDNPKADRGRGPATASMWSMRRRL